MGMYRRNLALAGDLIARAQPRLVEQRSEPRHSDFVERAVITFRGQDHLVPVVNISSRGTMVESDIVPRIGDSVAVQFEGCTRIQAFVRWSRAARPGLNFGQQRKSVG